MGVRVKVRIEVGSKSVIVPALVNSGYEAEGPEVSVPIQVARELGLWPLERFRIAEVETAGGPAHVYVPTERAKVRLVLGRPGEPEVDCHIVIDPYTNEVLLCDHLIDALGIVVVSFGRGLWRHKDDPEDTIRQSEQRPPNSR